MNNHNKKRAFSFNIIDVALIIIALIAISSLVFLLMGRQISTTSGTKTVSLEYKVEFSPTRQEYKNLIKIGDSFTYTESLSDIGEVVDVTYSDYYYKGVNENGQTVQTPYPNMITITVTLRADAVKTDTGYEINGCPIIVNEDLNIRVPFFTGTGKITSITVAND